jgi:hypothetical protein
VLWNFLGTYCSRYSDMHGYWLFGFLVRELGELRIDLLAPSSVESSGALDAAIRLAAEKFENQARKGGLVPSQVLGAWLTIRRLPGETEAMVNGHARIGYRVSFRAEAMMKAGRRYEKQQTVVIAPHDPEIERRSGRAA